MLFEMCVFARFFLFGLFSIGVEASDNMKSMSTVQRVFVVVLRQAIRYPNECTAVFSVFRLLFVYEILSPTISLSLSFSFLNGQMKRKEKKEI